MSQRFKEMNIVEIFWWVDWLENKKNRLLTRCRRLEKENRQLTDWLIRKAKRSTIDCRCSKFTDWLTFKTKNQLLSRFVDLKMLYVNFSFNSRKRHVSWFFSKELSFRENSICYFTHEDSFCDFVILSENLNWTSNEQHSSFSKKKFFHSRKFTIILVDSRLFSLIHDAHNENEIHSSFSKKKFHILAILFRLLAYFDEQSTRDRKFDRMSISLAEFRTRNRMLETMNHRHCWLIKKFRVENVRSSRIDRFCFFLLANCLRMWNLHCSSRWKSNIM